MHTLGFSQYPCGMWHYYSLLLLSIMFVSALIIQMEQHTLNAYRLANEISLRRSRLGEFKMIKTSFHKSRLHFGATILVGASGALFLAACATTSTEPTLALRAAEQAISTADRARVADVASPELSEARDKYTAALTAVHDDRMTDAGRLAYESRVDAELASSKFEAAKAQAANDEIRSSTDMLVQEMQRNTGAKQ